MKVRIGPAISWAFDTLRSRFGAFVALAAVPTIIIVMQQFVSLPIETILVDCTQAETEAQQLACATGLGATLLATFAQVLAFGLLFMLATIGVYRGALRASSGQVPSITDLLQAERLGSFVLVQLLSAVIVVVGLLLCIVPGLIALVAFQLAPLFVLDRGLSPVKALGASARAIRTHVGAGALTALISFAVLGVGGALWGIATLIALPFAALFLAAMYRQFTREEVL